MAPPEPPIPRPNPNYSKSTPNLPTFRSLGEEEEDTPTTAIDNGSLEDFPDLESDISSDEEHQDVLSLPTKPPPPKRPVFNALHSRSHTYLGPPTTFSFAPPFYNRPPTPLPPSPSLTSLLRPSFSAHPSRPATPDHSSDDGTTAATGLITGTATPNTTSAAASTLTTSFHTAKPIPRASPKVPTYEYYGFTLYLISSLVFVMYILWSYLPSPFLHQLGIYYYPNRWWSLAIPAWLVMLIVWIYIALASYNTGYLTLEMGMLECFVDEAANIAVVDSKGRIVREDRWAVRRGEKVQMGERGKRKGMGSRRGSAIGVELDWRGLWNEGTDAVMDVPIGGVCEVLYGRGRDDLVG